MLTMISTTVAINVGVTFALLNYAFEKDDNLDSYSEFKAPFVVVDMKKIFKDKMELVQFEIANKQQNGFMLDNKRIQMLGADIAAQFTQEVSKIREEGFVVLSKDAVISAPEFIEKTEYISNKMKFNIGN
jgi:hypothetical protein